MDEPLVWYEGSGTSDRRWLVADERGSIVSVTDGTGAAIAVNKYDEFGKPHANNQGRFQYTGQMWLPEVGLYHYKNRTYSPGLGRFLQADPIGYLGGMNLYAYAGNDPVNNRDPFGLTAACSPEADVCVIEERPKNPFGTPQATVGFWLGSPGGWENGLSSAMTLVAFQVGDDKNGEEASEEKKDKREKPKTPECLRAERKLDRAEESEVFIAVGGFLGTFGAALASGPVGAGFAGAAWIVIQENAKRDSDVARMDRDEICTSQ